MNKKVIALASLILLSLASCGQEVSFSSVTDSSQAASLFTSYTSAYKQDKTNTSVWAEEKYSVYCVDTKTEENGYDYKIGMEYKDGFHFYASMDYDVSNYFTSDVYSTADASSYTTYFAGKYYNSSASKTISIVVPEVSLTDTYVFPLGQPALTSYTDKDIGNFLRYSIKYTDFSKIDAAKAVVLLGSDESLKIRVDSTDLIEEYTLDKSGNLTNYYQEYEWSDAQTNYTYEGKTNITIAYNVSISQISGHTGFGAGTDDQKKLAAQIVSAYDSLTLL